MENISYFCVVQHQTTAAWAFFFFLAVWVYFVFNVKWLCDLTVLQVVCRCVQLAGLIYSWMLILIQWLYVWVSFLVRSLSECTALSSVLAGFVLYKFWLLSLHQQGFTLAKTFLWVCWWQYHTFIYSRLFGGSEWSCLKTSTQKTTHPIKKLPQKKSGSHLQGG